MSYISNNLLPNETVLYKAKIHWAIYLSGALLLYLGFIIAQNTTDAPNNHLGLFIGLFGFYLFIKSFIYSKTTDFVITDMRIIAKLGWLSRKAVELRHEKVESLALDQGIIDRIFNKGSLILNGTGGGKIKVHSITGPTVFRRKAMEAIAHKS